MERSKKQKTLYLHIGMPKTGSTSLQSFLNVNRDALLEQSVIYPDTLSPGAINHSIMSPWTIDFVGIYTKPWTYYAKRFSNLINESDATTAIISAEVFVAEPPHIFDPYFSDHNIKIICYFRSFFSYLSSFYKQVVKEGTRIDLFQINLAKYLLIRLEEYIKIFGIENCIIKNFNALQKSGMLIQDFMETVGIAATEQLVFPDKANVAPSDAATMFLYQLSFLPILRHAYNKVSAEVQSFDLTLYADFRCTLLPKELFNLDADVLRQIRRQGELLQDPTWFDYCMEQKERFEAIGNEDLPPHIQHDIFNRLSKESQQIIIQAYPKARVRDSSQPLLPSMQNIPEEYFDMLVSLRNAYIGEQRTVMQLNSQIADRKNEKASEIKKTESVKKQLTDREHEKAIESKRLEAAKNEIAKLPSIPLKFAAHLFFAFITAITSQQSREILFVFISGIFDASWYLSEYPDVASAKTHPVLHYVRHGVNERRNPAPWFNTAYYLSTYPDVAASGLNPFYHYIRFGAKEGRLTQ